MNYFICKKESMNIRELIRNTPKIKNELCYIIGKGPSLQNLQTLENPKANVITINEAIVKVESLKLKNRIFSMQKDGASPHHLNQCQCKIHGHSVCPYSMVYPKNKKTILLVHEHESIDCLTDYQPRYTFSNLDYGMVWYEFSAMSAIQIAKELGAKKVCMIAFDSFTHQDSRTYNPARQTVVYDQDYGSQKNSLTQLLSTIEHEFMTPQE